MSAIWFLWFVLPMTWLALAARATMHEPKR